MTTSEAIYSLFHSRFPMVASYLWSDDMDQCEDDDIDYRDSEFFDDSANKQTFPEFEEEDDDW